MITLSPTVSALDEGFWIFDAFYKLDLHNLLYLLVQAFILQYLVVSPSI